MSSFQLKNVEKLCMEKVKSCIPKTSQQLMLSTAEIGPQPVNTVIIGKLLDVMRREETDIQKPLTKCTFQEVTTNTKANGFEVFILGNDTALFDKIFEKIGTTPSWGIFSNVFVSKLGGTNGKFILKLDSSTGLNAEILILCQNQCLGIKYDAINQVEDGNHHNIFVVVKGILKPETVLAKNASRHMMLTLVDPSCLTSPVTRPFLSLHIFFNKPEDKFPEPIEPGDILRIRSVMGNYYQPDGKMYGKINNANSVVKFKQVEDHDNVTPITSNQKYELTEPDKAKVRSLRHWWEEAKKEIEVDWVNHVLQGQDKQTDNREEGILTKERLISEVTEESTFHLICLVTGIRVVEHLGVVILKVTDGTWSQVYTTKRDLNNATQELNSQTEHVIFQSRDIYITVLDNLKKEAAELKEGDLVYLQNVCASELQSSCGAEKCPVLDFHMGSNAHCQIKKLFHDSSKFKTISRRLKRKEPPASSAEESENESKTALIKHLELVNRSFRQETSALNGSNSSDSLSSNKREEPKVSSFIPGSNSTPVKGVDCPSSSTRNGPTKNATTSSCKKSCSSSNSNEDPLHFIHGISRSEIITANQQMNQSQAHRKGNDSMDATYCILKDVVVLEESSVSSPGDPHTSISTLPIDHDLSNISPESENKEEVEMRYSAKVIKHKKHTCAHKLYYTDCPQYRKSSLTKFCNDSEVGDKCTVWALLKHIHVVPLDADADSNQLTSFKNWIWGLCTLCGYSLSSSDLRTQYTEMDLQTKDNLPCINPACCTSPFSRDIDNRKETPVTPYIKLELCLEDLSEDKEFCVDLYGDGAVLFFGCLPSFKWTVRNSVPFELQQKILVFGSIFRNQPLKFCLVKFSRPDGTHTIQIHETFFKACSC